LYYGKSFTVPTGCVHSQSKAVARLIDGQAKHPELVSAHADNLHALHQVAGGAG